MRILYHGGTKNIDVSLFWCTDSLTYAETFGPVSTFEVPDGAVIRSCEDDTANLHEWLCITRECRVLEAADGLPIWKFGRR
jgi:hypothetical protein